MKNKKIAHWIVFTATLLLVPLASATWTAYRTMGTTPVVGEPSCVNFGSGQAICVARGQQHTLMANQFGKNAWSGWIALSGLVTSDPSCVNDGTGSIVCGVTTATNTAAALVFDGTNWTAPIDSLVVTTSAPSCALVRSGRVLCAARTLSGGLTESVFKAMTWGKFLNTSATLTSAPACAGDTDGDVICLANGIVNNVNTVVANRYNGSKWDGFLSLGGAVSGVPPVCSTLGVKGQVMCFDRANNTAYYRNMFKSGIWQNSNWTGWGGITAGEVGPRISCAQTSAGNLACGIVFLGDSFLYTGTFNGTTWSAFAKTGLKPVFGGPACASLSSTKAICAVVGINTQTLSVTGP
jgi:hypothetical protein